MRDPRAQFGPAAASYLTSAVHSNPSALERIIEVVQPDGGVVVDVATGAGHTAYAFSPCVDRVIATDITEGMLKVTWDAARGRGLSNLDVLFAQAEDLPFRSASLEGVACRLGAHHFKSVPDFLRESRRVLKAEGWLLLVDTIGSEDDEADEQVDRLERLRDPSHARNFRRSEWVRMAGEAGFDVQVAETSAKELDAEDWMQRMSVPAADRETLRDMMRNATAEFASYLGLEEREGTLYFHLDELLMFARVSAA